MTLNILQKYANSWRLDHPDLKDVYETTYAKGVISDFKVDDPTDLVGTIHSQVKVTGDFGESDWIPLFYHPKAEYWDDENAKATDFDKDQVNFERAWMSFRCDDEVAVMLQKGVPVAVLGFADGVPRIGENWVKYQCPPLSSGNPDVLGFFGLYGPSDWNPFCQGIGPGGFTVTADEKGPDGKLLNLKTLSKYADGGGASHTGKTAYSPRLYFDGAVRRGHVSCASPALGCEWFDPPDGNGPSDCAWVQAECEVGFSEIIVPGFTTGYYLYSPALTTHYKCRVYVFVIGPILFACYIMLKADSSPSGGGYYKIDSNEFSQATFDWAGEPATEPYIYNPPPISGTFDEYFNGGPPSPGLDGSKWAAFGYANKAALYSKELYNKVLSHLPQILIDSVGNASFGSFLPELIDYSGVASYISTDGSETWYPDGIKLHTRPHTQEELQAAGMWPAKD